ncbi:unnamed protein product, partial [marine sediment metagenome]
NPKTNEKVNSLTIEENPSYQFPKEEKWYADSDEIEDCPKEINIEKIEVRFREGARDVINWNGTKYTVSPHFFIPNKTKLGINTIPESKEHKLAKNWIYNKIKQKKMMINYSSINKPYKYKNKLNLFDLPIDFEKVGIETSSSTFRGSRRIADVICPFIIKHPLLGNGIVFEIQFSKQKEKTKIDRELDWAIRGYSIAWLYQDDFNEISPLIIVLKENSIDVGSFAALIKQSNKLRVKNLKFTIQEECRKLEQKKEEIKYKIKDEIKNELLELTATEIKHLINNAIKELPNQQIPQRTYSSRMAT